MYIRERLRIFVAINPMFFFRATLINRRGNLPLILAIIVITGCLTVMRVLSKAAREPEDTMI